MRTAFAVAFCFMIIALAACSAISYRSHREIGKTLCKLELALIPPIFGNLLIIVSHNQTLSMLGYYTYFIGMDLIMLNLIRFTVKYCKSSRTEHTVPLPFYLVLIGDMVQYLFNPFFRHAFSTQEIMVEGSAYFRLVPHFGQTIHRIIDYGILFCIALVYIVIISKMPRIYKERYAVVLGAMSVVAIWQTFYIFSGTPIDRSMIGFGVFGILIFYISIYYRPVRLLDRLLSNIASDMQEALFVFDPNSNCIWANKLGIDLAETTASDIEKAKEILFELFGAIDQIQENVRVQRITGSGDELRYYSLERNPVYDERERLAGTYLRVRDNTAEQMRLKQEIYAATHDTLTGIYTKEYLFQRIRELMKNAADFSYLIGFIDVKNFKIVNDIFGSDFGDFALKSIADWIRKNACGKCLFGRLAGDTFGICMPKSFFNPEFLENELAGFTVNDGSVEYRLLIHIGIYEIMDTDMNTDISVMFDRAHLALSAIKEEYQRHVVVYDNNIREKVLWNQQISAQLYDALAEKQILPYLQPIADRNGKIVGAEALARWIHPEKGFLSPALFIPIFEKNGMIVEVDKHIWRCACEILAEWKEKYPELFISVNISPKDFYFTDVLADISELVKEFDIPTTALRIEITETVMMTDADEKMSLLEDFRKAGFIVEMDDFGSGYSSLNMLKNMPVDVLKIDMKFLGKARDDGKANTIVRNIIHLSEDLGISSLTEGVETEQQYLLLAEMGCKLFQGYYFAKPMSREDFEKLLVSDVPAED